ncbi:hypothetical protein BGW42_003924 [Actinomortierella wolfii]|nr:hypothetical protein BGW42_003924 [Actinomortierella wolfii]
MTRLTYTYLVALTLALFALTTSVEAAGNNERCGPIHSLYKQMVAPCTDNGAAIPNSDADPRWKPCVCQNNFYPVALAAENCMIGNSGANQLTPESLTALCQGTPGFVPPLQQKAPDSLAAALAAVTSISQSNPAPTGAPDGSNPNSASSTLSPLSATFMAVALVAVGYAL